MDCNEPVPASIDLHLCSQMKSRVVGCRIDEIARFTSTFKHSIFDRPTAALTARSFPPGQVRAVEERREAVLVAQRSCRQLLDLDLAEINWRRAHELSFAGRNDLFQVHCEADVAMCQRIGHVDL